MCPQSAAMGRTFLLILVCVCARARLPNPEGCLISPTAVAMQVQVARCCRASGGSVCAHSALLICFVPNLTCSLCSGEQAEAIEKEGIRPDVFLLINVRPPQTAVSPPDMGSSPLCMTRSACALVSWLAAADACDYAPMACTGA